MVTADRYLHHNRLLLPLDACSELVLSLSVMFSRSLFSRTARLHLTYRVAAAGRRSFTSSNILHTGDRPTHFTNILAGANFSAVQIKNVGPEGIHLEDGLIIPSSCLFIEGKVFLWNVPPAPWEGWKPEHFEVFDTIVPKPG